MVAVLEVDAVVVPLLGIEVEEGAEVTEEVSEEAVAVLLEVEEAAVEEAVAAQVAVVGSWSALPTEPQMAFAN